ncbi:penicillin-binding transpeptidase domain-containing protein [Nocardioides caeni]|uniref:Beta-lactamase n=1 Tax=Nocardioides caeni TaxID=574700 RepID=A0A4S8N0H5_9ACTN|nr:penicillin-binding transpeptidase domain-containing protein [Nocardioides caeni]THV08992.1 penicillin-binding protein [Nocardioides caeni]
MRRSSVAGLSVLLLAAVGLSACTGDDSDTGDDGARAVAQQLADALAAAAAPSAPEQTAAPDPFATMPFGETDAATVTEAYAAIVDDMDGIAPSVALGDVTVDGDAATAELEWSWPVVGDVDPWTYTAEVELARTGDQWTAAWAPSLVEPSLVEGDLLDAVTRSAPRGEVTGAGGVPLVKERPVVRVGIDRVRVAAGRAPASARALAQLVGIEVAPYVAAVRAAGDRAFVEAITYRQDELPSAVQASDIAGILLVDDTQALGPTRDFAAPILGRVGPVTAEMVADDPDNYRVGDIAGISGLQARYDDQLRGIPGRTVEVVSADDETPAREVYSHAVTPGEPLALTLDRELQLEAELILADTGPASALVAIRPSDGAILAAANGSGTAGRNDATYGRYAPGSTFKIVSSLALLRAGLTADSSVECPATTVVDGKQFKNYSDYPASSLGAIPLAEAVAQSCNTAFIGQRDQLADGDLADAAASLGLGIDHDLGFPAYFGEVPAPASETEGAAALIGQGRILASPMVMATVIASVQAGTTVVPRLVEQVDVDVPAEAAPLTAAEAKALRAMLRGVVTGGSGRGLADLPGQVIAKTGTAEYADGGTIRTHAWMVAAKGDLAVAVFVQTGDSGSSTAGPLLEEFLRNAG